MNVDDLCGLIGKRDTASPLARNSPCWSKLEIGSAITVEYANSYGYLIIDDVYKLPSIKSGCDYENVMIICQVIQFVPKNDTNRLEVEIWHIYPASACTIELIE